MRMFLISCVMLFVLVLVSALIKSKSPNQQATRKRNKKLKFQNLNNFPLEDATKPFHEEGIETDEKEADKVLGLNVTPVSTSTAQRANQAHENNVKLTQNNTDPAKPEKKPLFEYIVLHVMASEEKQFAGYELLQALLSNGMRYGKGKIFHYHESKHGQGEVLFSLASLNQPGTFDLPKMSHFSCPGLTLFILLKKVNKPEEAFERMLKVTKQLAQDLGGDVYSEDHRVLTLEKIKQLREGVQNYFENTRTVDLFD